MSSFLCLVIMLNKVGGHVDGTNIATTHNNDGDKRRVKFPKNV